MRPSTTDELKGPKVYLAAASLSAGHKNKQKPENKKQTKIRKHKKHKHVH
jgi:hypothetical protein